MLEEQFQWDTTNSTHTQTFLEQTYPGSIALFDELDDLFNKLSGLACATNPPYEMPTIAKLWILMACQRQLALGSSTLLRGHISNAHSNVRRAIELTAAAGKIVKEPDFAQVWFDSGKGDKEYDAYYKKSKVGELWNDSLETVAILKAKYKRVCRMVHVSIASMANQIKQHKEDGRIILAFEPHQLTVDGTELMIGFIFIIDSFFAILDALAEVWQVGKDLDWSIQLNSIRGKFFVCQERLRAAMNPEKFPG